MDQVIRVVGAIIMRNGAILCAQRGPAGSLAGLWEFPGGKLEEGEAPEEALEREIREELGCVITVDRHVETTTHVYDFATISLATYLCTLMEGEPEPSEHSELRWVAPRALHELEWAPADLPAVARIQAEFSET